MEKYGLKGKEVISALHVTDGLLKYYKYPATLSQKDLISSIDWAIKREQSMVKEETLYDYYILRDRGEDKSVGVVVVFARKESVENLKRLIESAGMKLKILDYEVVSIINYGIREKFPIPFSILYVDYDYFTLTSYSYASIVYSSTRLDFDTFLNTGDVDIIENFFAEVRNQIVISDSPNLYLAGPILEEQTLLDLAMENLPIIGLLDLPDIKPGFTIPYILSIRGMEG